MQIHFHIYPVITVHKKNIISFSNFKSLLSCCSVTLILLMYYLNTSMLLRIFVANMTTFIGDPSSISPSPYLYYSCFNTLLIHCSRYSATLYTGIITLNFTKFCIPLPFCCFITQRLPVSVV